MKPVRRVVRRQVHARSHITSITMTFCATSGLTTVLVMPTAARCAAWRWASGAPARNGKPARFGTFRTMIRAERRAVADAIQSVV